MLAGLNWESQGLVKQDGKPLFAGGMEVPAPFPVKGLKQRAKAPRLVIVELTLADLPYRLGTPGDLLRISLSQAYTLDPDRIHHEKVFFEILDGDAHRNHLVKMAGLAKEFQ